MAKSGNRVHGTLHGRIRRSGTTKAFLLQVMEEAGFALEQSDRLDVGEWNERVEFRAVKDESSCFLGSRFKGESMDWKGAIETFFVSTDGLGMSWADFQAQRANW